MLYVGRVSKEKNLDLIANALKRVPAGARIRPVFVGDGPYREEMQRLLPDAIFTGYLQGELLAVAYASADFFAFPSTTDTFGNVILEAHASALPVIVSDVGGPRDLVANGEDGYVTRAMDVDQLADCMTLLAMEPESRALMGAAGRRKVETRDWQEAFERFWDASPMEPQEK
jgi:glycosyltransferase involved in cell wall biosynthesis